MAFDREDREFIRPDSLPDWMRRFAEGELASEASGKEPFQEIRDLLGGKGGGKVSIEEKLAEMRARMGLDKLSGDDSPEGGLVSTASYNPARTALAGDLAALAISLEASGDPASAAAADRMLARLLKRAEDDGTPDSLKKHPDLKIFIDNVCRTRGGHVSVPAILKMVRDERPEEVAVDDALRRYVERRLSDDLQEVSDGSAAAAGAGVGMSATQEEEAEANKIF